MGIYHSVDGPRLSEYRETFGQPLVESSERRLCPNWRIKDTYYVHGYFKQNVRYAVLKPFINLYLQLPRLRFNDWETILKRPHSFAIMGSYGTHKTQKDKTTSMCP